jgi:SAM-dependent methyltransferase
LSLEGPARDAARERVRDLAHAAVARGEPAGWFDSLYREARGDATRVPWADLEPDASLLAWTADASSLRGVSDAVVVGCGLGHDAEHLAARGVSVVAFDVSPTAVDWARRLHAGSSVRYEVADLFALPAPWRSAFDLVVEIVTLQSLPPPAREPAFAAVASLPRPGGRVFLSTRLREDDEVPDGPPWPLSRAEIASGFPGWAWDLPLSETRDSAEPAIRRAFGVLRRP